jgi:threonine dehydratase
MRFGEFSHTLRLLEVLSVLMTQSAPDLDQIKSCRRQLGERIARTPLVRCVGLEEQLANGTHVYGKLEFLQRTGTFKARGALASLLTLSKSELAAGVTAVSAGNHAIATAYAAQVLGVNAKIVMIRSANKFRIDACRQHGADVIMADTAHMAFEMAEVICNREGRAFVHPFEGRSVALGTGTLGVEICEQIADFDALLVAVGGGGLLGGIANAVRQLRPEVEIIGVEAEGADSMHRSFAAGEPRSIEQVTTIADSLGAPFAMEYSFGLCRDNVDRLVLVDDDAIKRSMRLLFDVQKFAVEPACAASTAALFGPLRDDFPGRKVVLLYCGSNIDWATYAGHAGLGNG